MFGLRKLGAQVATSDLDLSRFRAAPDAHLGHFPFECDRAFPA